MSPKSDLKVLFKKKPKKNQRDKARGSHVSRKTWKMIDQFYSHGKHMENEGKKVSNVMETVKPYEKIQYPPPAL